MAEIRLEIKKRNRDYGLLTWSLRDDFDIKTLFQQKEQISIKIDGKPKTVKVSYKYRRLAIGKRNIEKYAEKQFFVLRKISDGLISVEFA